MPIIIRKGSAASSPAAQLATDVMATSGGAVAAASEPAMPPQLDTAAASASNDAMKSTPTLVAPPAAEPPKDQPAGPTSGDTAAPKARPSLADLYELVATSPIHTATAIRDMRSAIKRTASIAGLPMSQVPADAASIRDILQPANAKRLGLSSRRLSNIKAAVQRAYELVGVGRTLIWPMEHSTPWRVFLAKARAKHHSYVLSRFATFCTKQGIAPAEGTSETLEAYRLCLDCCLVANDPNKIAKDTAAAFNAIVKHARLEQPLISHRRSAPYRARPLDTYPASFKADLDRYLRRLAEPELFDTDTVTTPLRPTTLRNIEAHVRQLADAAVDAGYSPDRLQSLEDLVDTTLLSRAAQVICARRGSKAPVGLKNIMASILNIARHYVKSPQPVIDSIAKAKAKLTKANGDGRPCMTEKNKDRLRQFEDPAAFRGLVMLPEVLMKRADAGKGTDRAAMDAMAAVAIAILLACPMRAANLAALDIKRHLRIKRVGKTVECSITIAPEEVKNRQEIAVKLTDWASRLIVRFLEHHHPALAAKSTALFPRRDGQPRPPRHFAEFVKTRIWKELGLEVNLHLFRHLAATKYLEARPGDYESARRILGHAKVETTTAFYASGETKAAYKLYHQSVLQPSDDWL